MRWSDATARTSEANNPKGETRLGERDRGLVPGLERAGEAASKSSRRWLGGDGTKTLRPPALRACWTRGVGAAGDAPPSARSGSVPLCIGGLILVLDPDDDEWCILIAAKGVFIVDGAWIVEELTRNGYAQK